MGSPFPDVEIPEVPFTDFVLAHAGQLGEKPALIDAPSGRTITYAQLLESVRAVAAGLADRGFGKGDVFAHYAPNSPEYAVTFHAVARGGGVNTTANPLLTAEELAAQLSHSGARLLVTVPELLEKATAAAERAEVEEVFVYGEAAALTPFASLLGTVGEPPEVTIDPARAAPGQHGAQVLRGRVGVDQGRGRRAVRQERADHLELHPVAIGQRGVGVAQPVRGCAALPAPVRMAYEAGPTGFSLARALWAAGVECVVAAPGKIERPALDRVKTDRRDASGWCGF
jgi:hypothetical protein